jgi:hypothetical protein
VVCGGVEDEDEDEDDGAKNTRLLPPPSLSSATRAFSSFKGESVGGGAKGEEDKTFLLSFWPPLKLNSAEEGVCGERGFTSSSLMSLSPRGCSSRASFIIRDARAGASLLLCGWGMSSIIFCVLVNACRI